MPPTRINATTWLTNGGQTVTWDGTTLTIDGTIVPPAYRAAAIRDALNIQAPELPDDAAALAMHGAEIWTPHRGGM